MSDSKPLSLGAMESLQLENMLLRETSTQQSLHITELRGDSDRLRAENASLSSAKFLFADEIRTLRAENARLQSAYDEACEKWSEEVRSAESENPGHAGCVDEIDHLRTEKSQLAADLIDFIDACKAAIPQSEHPKEETPHNWSWQIRMLGEDRRAAYRKNARQAETIARLRRVLDEEPSANTAQQLLDKIRLLLS
jgi:hypothetical protein